MDAAVASKSEHGKIARVAAPVGRDGFYGASHNSVHHLVNAVGGSNQFHAERPSHLVRHNLSAQLTVNGHAAAGEGLRVQVPQHHVCVGDGGFVPSQAITGGPWDGARAVGADLQRTPLVQPDDASASRADLGDVNRRQFKSVTPSGDEPAGERNPSADLVFIRPDEFAVLDQGRLGGRSAHIEGNYVRVARSRPHVPGTDHPGGRAALDDLGGFFHNRLHLDHAPRRLHHQHSLGQAARIQLLDQGLQIGLDRWPHQRIDHGGTGTLVFPNLRQNLGRQRQIKVGKRLA